MDMGGEVYVYGLSRTKLYRGRFLGLSNQKSMSKDYLDQKQQP